MSHQELVPVTVSIQGQEGSYHDEAASFYFGDSYHPRYLKTFRNVFDAVAEGASDYGLSAVENTLVGSIAPVYDLLRTSQDLSIQGEIFLSIHHALIGQPGTALESIRTVYSHPVALDQCTEFMRQSLPNATGQPYDDTVSSVALAKELADPAVAAIAGTRNAERYGLGILSERIEDNPENFTRFLVLGRSVDDSEERRAQATKTSLFIDRLTGDEDELAPGTLHKALGCFAMAGIGLTKVESRPVVGRPWRYNFYVDCAAGALDSRMLEAEQGLYGIGASWRQLGTYQAGATYQS